MKENKTKIKICGLRRLKDIEIVNELKPDYIGFVFTKSPRQIDFKQAKILKDKLDKDILAVGVFVNSDIEDIIYLIKNNIISIVQLHGDEDEEFIAEIKEFDNDIKIIKAIEIKNDSLKEFNDEFRNDGLKEFNDEFRNDGLKKYGAEIKKWEDSNVDYLLLDSGKGSGKTFNWRVIGDVKKPFFLAGGISSENIIDASKINPFAIDISSGAEKNGFKSYKKINKIINKLK